MQNKKKKICYILPEYQKSGSTHFSYIEGFLKKTSDFFDIFLIIEKGQKPEANLGCRKIYFSSCGSGRIKYLFVFFSVARAALSGCRIFYVHYSFLGALIASFFAHFSGGRVFYWNCGEPWKYKRGKWRHFIERRAYKSIDFLVTGGDSLAAFYAKEYDLNPKRIKVMPNWIDLEKWLKELRGADPEEVRKEISAEADKKVIVFVHRLSRRKGAHLLPAIIKNLNLPQVLLLIIGDGPERSEIESEFSRSGLKNNVKFLGWVPNKEIFRYLAAADAFLMPSQEEGFPHVLLEAMVAGVPFTASRVGLVSEIIPGQAQEYLVEEGYIEGFSDALRRILGLTQEEKNVLRAAMLERARVFDIGNVALIFKRILES